MSSVYFENIKSILVQELTRASESLKIAVAWLNDPVLFEIISEKAKTISVELLVVNDRLNNTCGNDFNSFIQTSYGKLYLAETSKLMHNKFTIVDNKYIITGSYNWTRGARNNRENIVVIDKLDVVNKFCLEFESLKNMYGPSVTDYNKAKDTKADAIQSEFTTELPIDEMMRHGLLPFDIGVFTRNDSFAIALHKNDRLPITRKQLHYNTADSNQISFQFKIKKQRSIQGEIKDVGQFILDFSQKCLMQNIHKADLFFSVSLTGELAIECKEIEGNKTVLFSYDLLKNVRLS